MMIKLLPCLSVLVFFLSSCGSFRSAQEEVTLPDHPTTQATLWVQQSAEYSANTIQTYQTALRNLGVPLVDSYWTALPSQENRKDLPSLPPAIILDVDETVLDNSPFQARMIKAQSGFDPEAWNAWCLEAKANGIPGAASFTTFAANKGIQIFYITNREYIVEEATRKNLKDQGFPVSDSLDAILTKGEQPGWTSSKIERRNQIEKHYRVIMIFGDDLNDFLPAKDISREERSALVQEHRKMFGERWFILPNPVYGSWDQALYDFESDLTETERARILNQRLNTQE